MHDYYLNHLRVDLQRPNKMSEEELAALVSTENFGHHALRYQLDGSVAVIPVNGCISTARISGWYWFANITYESILATIEHVREEHGVETVVLAFNSPGGTVMGCAETAEKLQALGETVTIVSHCAMADSAAYWLASATSRIVVEPAGEVGSIGVIMSHFDYSKMMEAWGVSVTHIHSGAHKADGSPYKALTEEAQARYQADMDYLRDMFVDAVAENRGVDRESIKATEASTYRGALGVDIGLADDIGYLSQLIETFNSNETTTTQELAMKTKVKPDAKNPKAQNDKGGKKNSPAAAKEGEETEGDEGEGEETEGDEGEGEETEGDKDKAAAQVERARISAILSHASAKGREELAQELAFNSDMLPEAAVKLLEKAPAAAAEEDKTFANTMRSHHQPALKPSSEGGQQKNPLLAAQQAFRPSTIKKTA